MVSKRIFSLAAISLETGGDGVVVFVFGGVVAHCGIGNDAITISTTSAAAFCIMAQPSRALFVFRQVTQMLHVAESAKAFLKERIA